MQQAFIELILALNTNSEKDRYNALLECINLNTSLFSDEEKQNLIASYKAARDLKVEVGKKNASKRWHKNNKTTANGGKWLFITSPYRSPCTKCKDFYEAQEHIFVGKPGNHGYHVDCAPDEAKIDETAKPFYDKWLSLQGAKR